MQFVNRLLLCCTLTLLVSLAGNRQDNVSSSTTAVVPRLANFPGEASDDRVKPVARIVGFTFSIYQQQYAGVEIQNDIESSWRIS
jgi:hypothetical protein